MLVATLGYEDDAVIGRRPMWPCVRQDCGCYGVFFRDLPACNPRLSLEFWREGVDGVRDPTFQHADPVVTLWYTTQATEQEFKRATRGPVWDPKLCAWRFEKLVPVHPTTRVDAVRGLAQFRIQVGGRDMHTQPFEVATKVSQWVLVRPIHAVRVPEVLSLLRARFGRTGDPLRVVQGAAWAWVKFRSRQECGDAYLEWPLDVLPVSTLTRVDNGEWGLHALPCPPASAALLEAVEVVPPAVPVMLPQVVEGPSLPTEAPDEDLLACLDTVQLLPDAYVWDLDLA
jgi:hypothetical protein